MFFSFSGARMKVSVGEIKQLKFKEKGLFNQKKDEIKWETWRRLIPLNKS